MATKSELLALAALIKAETGVDLNTSTRVGTLFENIVTHFEDEITSIDAHATTIDENIASIEESITLIQENYLQEKIPIDLTADSWLAALQFDARADGIYIVETIGKSPSQDYVLGSYTDGPYTRDFPEGLPQPAAGSHMWYWLEIKGLSVTKLGVVTPLIGTVAPAVFVPYKSYIWDMTSVVVAGVANLINNKVDAIMRASDMSAYATLSSPEFTGIPKAPTQVTADDSTRIATTAFVKAAIAEALATL